MCIRDRREVGVCIYAERYGALCGKLRVCILNLIFRLHALLGGRFIFVAVQFFVLHNLPPVSYTHLEAALTVVPVFGSTVLHIKISAASKKAAAVRESFFTFCIVLPNTGTTVSAASAELTSIGLAEHALRAYRDGWQYSYGAYGNFNSNGVRASDCSGLIYSYFCWVDDNSNIQPNWNYPRTVTAQANDAVESGPIDTIPRTHGLIVTIANYDHVGVYVGNGMVVDNSTWGVNMRYESIPGHGWLQWHKLGSITYPTTGWYKFDGDYFYYENGEYVINTTRTINGVTYTFGSDGVSDKTPSSANGSFSEADSAFNAKTTAAVSYTHLDVYKRQLQPRLDAEAQPGIDLLQCFFVSHY